jgi:hypothetical protein
MRILKIITATVYLKEHYRSTLYAYFVPTECKWEEGGQGLKITEWYLRFSWRGPRR